MVSYGVIVGRFQVPNLHDGHKELIDYVYSKHNQVIIFLGTSPVKISKRNPLDFTTRKNMIIADYPNATIIPIADTPSDKKWSEILDNKIKEFNCDSVTLYGSRDSFISHYKGIYKTVEYEHSTIVSGTEIRKKLSESIQSNADWRSGIIFASSNRYSISYQTVDIIPIDSEIKDKTFKVLLGRKLNETNYRFIGGFVDTKDESLENAAKRELKEESGYNAEFSEPVYIGSHRVNDWRYASEDDKIMTSIFVCKKLWGRVEASDDIAELKWFQYDELTFENFVIEHVPLFEIFSFWVNNKLNN